MSLSATWTLICTGCGKLSERTITLDEWEAGGYQSYSDIWGPGVPHGWLQTAPGKGRSRAFFHSHACYEHWLEEQGLHVEAEKFRHAVWTA